MKKYLYATTAIIGASFAATSANAQGVDVNMSGFVNAYYGLIDIDSSAVNDETREASYQEVEAKFGGSVMLDNGVEAGVYFENELEGGVSEADEQYLYLSGSFGSLQLGQQNGAMYVTHAGGSQAYAAGVPVNSGWFTFGGPNYNGNFLAPGYTTFGDMVNDDNGVVYKTPNIGGFQLAASWHAVSGVGNGGTGGSFVNVNDNTQQNNAVSIGANFSRDLNGVGISASAGYGTEDRPNSPNGDPDMFSASLGASVAGFSFGGDVLVQDDGGANDGESYALGAAYSTGPWTAGINGITSEIEGNTALNGEDGRDALSVGLDYAMGPGVKLSSSVIYQEFRTEEANNDGQHEALGGYLGATVSF